METLKREVAARKEAEKKIKSLQEELDLARKEIQQMKGQQNDSTTMTADEQGGATGSRANMVL